MSTKTATTVTWSLASVELANAYQDFILSRQAMRVSRGTLTWYTATAGKFVAWLETQQVTDPAQVTAKHIRAYLAELAGRKLSDWTSNGHARAVRAMMNFWLAEGYMKDPVKVEMPRVGKKRLLSLSGDEVTKILTKCSKREKAIILLMVDTGLRRAEVCTLNWGDVDMGSGLCKVKQGKGNKDRSTVIGASARRALLAYKRTLERAESKDPVIQTDEGGRFAGSGLYRLFKRLEKRVGMSITPHSLRRSFVTLSLRAGMNPLHLQTMLGHASLEMVQHYAQMIDDDILQAHEDYSPADRL